MARVRIIFQENLISHFKGENYENIISLSQDFIYISDLVIELYGTGDGPGEGEAAGGRLDPAKWETS